jgi:hypothetical protein
MKIISLDLQNDADIIKEELTNSKDEWFWPVDKKHKIFEQARMKFINRNLNYFNFPSMVAQTMEGNDFNPELPKTLDFCNKVRTLTGNNGPFGRMCLWELGPGCKLLRHKDDFRYHLYITRNIFIISDNKDANRQIVINNNKVPCEKGTLFQFSPAFRKRAVVQLRSYPYGPLLRGLCARYDSFRHGAPGLCPPRDSRTCPGRPRG